MKVRAGSLYVYVPAGWDLFDARTDLKKGELVVVVNLPGCPSANTMKHAHVNRYVGGKFAGLVCTASLQAVRMSRDGWPRLVKRKDESNEQYDARVSQARPV